MASYIYFENISGKDSEREREIEWRGGNMMLNLNVIRNVHTAPLLKNVWEFSRGRESNVYVHVLFSNKLEYNTKMVCKINACFKRFYLCRQILSYCIHDKFTIVFELFSKYLLTFIIYIGFLLVCRL